MSETQLDMEYNTLIKQQARNRIMETVWASGRVERKGFNAKVNGEMPVKVKKEYDKRLTIPTVKSVRVL